MYEPHIFSYLSLCYASNVTSNGLEIRRLKAMDYEVTQDNSNADEDW